MSVAAERWATHAPGRMESHSTSRALAHPRCTLQELAPEDIQQTMCDSLHDEEAKRPSIRTDEETFRLHLEFVHAHGLPKGEYTTFSNVGALNVNGKPVRHVRGAPEK